MPGNLSDLYHFVKYFFKSTILNENLKYQCFRKGQRNSITFAILKIHVHEWNPIHNSNVKESVYKTG